MTEIENKSTGLEVPAVHLIPSSSASSTYLGGEPVQFDVAGWPKYRGKKLDFLAQIDMSTLRETRTLDWLPPTGRLLFFYDIAKQPWGRDPFDSRHAAVLWRNDGENAPYLGQKLCLDMAMRPIGSLPGPRRKLVQDLALSKAEQDLYWDLMHDRYGEERHHQIGGFPLPIQGDTMELSCQLVDAGIRADSVGFRDPRRQELEAGAPDWRLLLQLDSDNRLELLWADEGKLYFWVRESDARNRDFSKIRCILQSS